MSSDEFCKGCRETVHLSQAEIEQIFDAQIKIKSVKLVDEATYQKRLELCLSCPSLDYGTTCRHCACIVQIKAKLAAAACPFPMAPKW